MVVSIFLFVLCRFFRKKKNVDGFSYQALLLVATLLHYSISTLVQSALVPFHPCIGFGYRTALANIHSPAGRSNSGAEGKTGGGGVEGVADNANGFVFLSSITSKVGLIYENKITEGIRPTIPQQE